eukprot:scaffold6757_cov38-Prasinocladus_malaysianus.AAC.2
MGGTSTDVSRFAGNYEHVFETTTAGITIQVQTSHHTPPPSKASPLQPLIQTSVCKSMDCKANVPLFPFRRVV